MTTYDLKAITTFERSLTDGSKIVACWTNNYRTFRVRAEIVKVNQESFRIRLLEEVKDKYDGRLLYEAGRSFSIPRMTWGSGGKLWSINNRVEPIGGY